MDYPSGGQKAEGRRKVSLSNVMSERLNRPLLALKMVGGPPEPRNVGSLQKLEKAKKRMPPECPKECKPCGHCSERSLVRPILDLPYRTGR